MKIVGKHQFRHVVIIVSILMIMPAAAIHAAPTPISSFSEKIAITNDGNAKIRSEIDIAELDDVQTLQLPMNFKNATDITIRSLNSEKKPLLQYQLTEKNGQKYLELSGIDAGQTAMPLVIEYNVADFLDWEDAGPEEFNTYEWKYRFNNFSQHTIEKYSAEVVLPEGWSFHKVLKSKPKVTKKTPKLPYRFFKNDAKYHLLIDDKEIAFGDSVYLEFAFKRVKRSPVILFIALIFGALYLFFFRDLLVKYRKIRLEEKADKAAQLVG